MSSASRVVGPRYRIPPFEMRWDALTSPLPVRAVRCSARLVEAPPWIDSGAPRAPFHFSERMRDLCADIAAKYEPMRHIDVSRMIFAITPSRHPRVHGVQAKVTPLRFANGELTRILRGIPYQIQQFFHDEREIYYIMSFSVPRFLNRHFEDKFVTVFHELFHISPAFNGDLRRHSGRYAIHTASQKRYDQEMSAMAREYVQSGADPKKFGFLKLNYGQLRHRHTHVIGHVAPRPKIIPVRTGLH